MDNNSGIPREYTPCETYKQHVIGLYAGSYYAFLNGVRLQRGGRDTKEAARRMIDAVTPKGMAR